LDGSLGMGGVLGLADWVWEFGHDTLEIFLFRRRLNDLFYFMYLFGFHFKQFTLEEFTLNNSLYAVHFKQFTRSDSL
jgi:hypothetical protein